MLMRYALPMVAVVAAVGCDGPREEAGEKADAAANMSGGTLTKGPNERVGEIQDRIVRDKATAVEATADTAEDRADEVREVADQRADSLERQAEEIRQSARKTAETLDRRADDIRGR